MAAAGEAGPGAAAEGGSAWGSVREVLPDKNDFIAGCVAGFVGKFFEYPLDTVKVRLQTMGTAYGGPMDCLRQTYQNEGVRGLYKGITPPLLGSMAEQAVLFASYHWLENQLDNAYGLGKGVASPYWSALLCGGFSGACVSHVLTPTELLKCRLQIDRGDANPRYKGPVDCLMQTVRQEGPSTLFKGHSATLVREVPGNVAWFGAYEGLVRAQVSWYLPPGKGKDDLPAWRIMLAGGFAGSAYWAIPYPADVVKSRMQTQAGSMSFSTMLRQIWREEGLRGLYAGCGMTSARAFPSNGIIFATYELVARNLPP